MARRIVEALGCVPGAIVREAIRAVSLRSHRVLPPTPPPRAPNRGTSTTAVPVMPPSALAPAFVRPGESAAGATNAATGQATPSSIGVGVAVGSAAHTAGAITMPTLTAAAADPTSVPPMPAAGLGFVGVGARMHSDGLQPPVNFMSGVGLVPPVELAGLGMGMGMGVGMGVVGGMVLPPRPPSLSGGLSGDSLLGLRPSLTASGIVAPARRPRAHATTPAGGAGADGAGVSGADGADGLGDDHTSTSPVAVGGGGNMVGLNVDNPEGDEASGFVDAMLESVG